MARVRPNRIRLCGRFEMELDGRRVEDRLPGRQGRLVVALLALGRGRAVGRDELIDALWPATPPADPGEALSALLSKVRHALGGGFVAGRRELSLELPGGAEIDLAEAAAAAERGERALASGEHRQAFDAGRAAAETAGRGFLVGLDAPWVEDRRREVEELRLRAIELVAAAGASLGGAELAAAERAGRELVRAAPLRESGHRLLMEALAARGDVAEALQLYDDLRLLLREELGTHPSDAVKALHERLLRGGTPAAPVPAGAQAPREERKLVSVVSLELTAHGEADPEELRSRLAPVRDRLRELVASFGGRLEEGAVSPAIAVFGAPSAHEDDPARALGAARRAIELGLAARAGVASGEALVGGAVTGQVVSTAARLQASARPGSALADDATASATARLGGHEQRGTVAGEPRERTPLVGRRNELELLGSLERSTREERRPRLITVVGNAGVGKSRLVDEFVERFRGQVHRGRCLPYGEGITYWPLREVLWSAAGIALVDPATAAEEKLRALVGGLVDPAERERVASALAVGAGISLPGNALEQVSPDAVAHELGLAWPRLLSALAAERSTLLVIEDLHWAEPQLLDTLDLIVRRCEGPLLVLASTRPELLERRPGWSVGAAMTQLALDRLTRVQTRELVAWLLPDAADELRERVVGSAEGNPFFAEELARHLGGVRGTGAVPLPRGVRAVIAARIDALPEGAKRVLQDAAVVGRTFWATTLQSMGSGDELGEALRELERRGFVVTRPASSLAGEHELSFSHALTREVAYESITRAHRCRAHARVARWLDELAGDRRDEFIDLLAHHYEAAAAPADTQLAWPADSPEREAVRAHAVAALLDAGGMACRRQALADAVRFADRALALAAFDAERLAALELRGRAHHAALRGNEALEAYLEALALTDTVGDRAAASRIRAHAVMLCTRYNGAFSGDAWKPQAVELVEQGLAETAEEATFERGALLVGRAWGIDRWREPGQRDLDAARRDARRAVEIAEAIGSEELLSAALEGLTWVVFEDGFGLMGQLGDRLMRASAGMADLVEAHESIVVAAACFAYAGRYEDAAVAAAEATRRAARLSPHRALHAAAAEVVSHLRAGRFEEVSQGTLRVPELAASEGRRTCPRGLEALAGYALARFELGDRAAAERALELQHRLAPSALDFRAYGHPVGEILRPLAGIEQTRLLVEGAQSLPDRGHSVLRLRAQLPFYALAREWATLDRLTAEARALAGPARAPVLDCFADWAQAIPLADAGRPAEALSLARGAASRLDALGEHYTAARLLVDLLPFLPPAEAGPLAEATAMRLEAMGARASAARAREALQRA